MPKKGESPYKRTVGLDVPHPFAKEVKKKRPRVIFPVELIFEDGSSLTVNSVQEMRQAWKDNCKRGGGDESTGGGTRG